MSGRYSLIHEHDDHFQIHDAQDNTHFKMAKKTLHPATQIKVMKLKKFAEGGDVDADEEVPVTSTSSEATAEPPAAPDLAAPIVPTQAMLGQPTGTAPPPEWHAPLLPADPLQPQAQAPQNAEGPTVAPDSQGPQPYAMPGMEEMAQGLKTQAGAQQQMANAQQDAIRQNQQQMAVHEAQYQDSLKRVEGEQAVFQKQLQDGKIDPRRFFHNQNTGQRVGTAIAMILGGIGAGLSHGPNLAMQMIDKAVDQDIESQKSELGKTQNLLGLNMQKYHNLQTAEAATRLHYNTVLGMQLQAAQSKATNGIAQGALQMKLGELKHNDALYRQQIALQGVKTAQLGGAGGEGGIPVGQEPSIMLTDPKYQERRVVVNGKAYLANDKEEAEKLRRTESIAGPVVSSIQQLNQLAHDPMTKLAGSESNNRAHAIIGQVAVQLPQLSGLTRINEVEIKHLLDSISDPTRLDQAMGSVKNAQTIKTIEEDMESKRSNSLMGYKGMGSVKSFAPAGGGKLPLNGK